MPFYMNAFTALVGAQIIAFAKSKVWEEHSGEEKVPVAA